MLLKMGVVCNHFTLSLKLLILALLLFMRLQDVGCGFSTVPPQEQLDSNYSRVTDSPY